MLNRYKQALRSHHNPAVLSINNTFYQKEIKRFVFQSIISDLYPKGDITSNAIFSKNQTCKAELLCKSNGIIAGLKEAEYIVLLVNKRFKSSVQIKLLAQDGSSIKKGHVIAVFSGDIKSIFALERTILNLTQRMSGIASMTHQLKEKVSKINPDLLLCSTRKTPLGLLDKKAVIIGGGCTHRINLSDGILIKDTHLDLYRRDMATVLNNTKNYRIKSRFIEIEVQSHEEAKTAAKFFKTHHIYGTIMLDNMMPKEIKDSITNLKHEQLYDNVLFEASGNINEKNIQDFAKTGVDIISLGFLTHSVKAMDISLKLAISD